MSLLEMERGWAIKGVRVFVVVSHMIFFLISGARSHTSSGAFGRSEGTQKRSRVVPTYVVEGTSILNYAPTRVLSVEHGSGCVLFFKISVCFLRPSLFSCFFTLPLVVPLQFVAPLRRACLATRLKAV